MFLHYNQRLTVTNAEPNLIKIQLAKLPRRSSNLTAEQSPQKLDGHEELQQFQKYSLKGGMPYR